MSSTRTCVADRRRLLAAVALVVAALCTSTSMTAAEATTTTTSIRVPIAQSLGDPPILGHPCGTGENILLSGEMHVVVHRTHAASGGDHYLVEVNDQGISGVSLERGTEYRAIRASSISRNLTDGASQLAEVVSMHLIAQGGAEDFHVQWVLRLTFNAAGEPTAVVDFFRASCEIVS